jgi:hypothetical protein
MAEKQAPDDDLETLLGEDDPLASEEAEPSALKGVEPKSPPWGPEMFASAAYHRNRYADEWTNRVAEADDATIAETFALATRLLQVMREELASRLAQ